MTDRYGFPESMRAFAETGMEQARKAFDEFLAASTGAGGGTAGGADQQARRAAQALARETMTFAEAQIAASFEFARKLAESRGAEDMAEVQRDFVRQQIAALADQSRRLGRIVEEAQDSGPFGT